MSPLKRTRTAWASLTLVLFVSAAPIGAEGPPASLPPAASPQAPTLSRYAIRQDDTLWDLAGAFYGKPWLWPLFLKFNSIPDPDLIHPGQSLLFPQEEVLLHIREKTEEQVKEVREGLERQATPVTVEVLPEPPRGGVDIPEPPPGPGPGKEEAAPPAPSGTPSPTPKPPALKVTGSKSINLSFGEALGNSGNGYTNTGYDRHETFRLQVEGQLGDEVKVLGRFAQSDLALEDEFDLTLSNKDWELFLGNFQASLPGSRFLSTSLSTTGARLTGRMGPWSLTAIYATPRGKPLYQKFSGNETQGPYSIQGAPLAPGSETLKLNGQPLTRGVDYSLDSLTGTLNFQNRIIHLTDLVEVEAQSRSAAYDTQVYGYRVETSLLGAPAGRPTAPPAVRSGVAGPGSFQLTGAPQGNQPPGPLSAATPSAGEASWRIGQGYMRQLERPDPGVTTTTARAATDVHMLELDTTLDLGPPLKLSGEADYSLLFSHDLALTPEKQGAAYRLEGDTFQGPFHLQARVSGTTPGFSPIGSALTSGDFLEWALAGDAKEGEALFAKADRAFRRTFAGGQRDETVTDHAEVRVKPAGWPEAEYVYYRSGQEREGPPFRQETRRHTAGLGFAFAGFKAKASALSEGQEGTDLGRSGSYGGRFELASVNWKAFNFAVSGEWRLNDIVEAGSNTSVPTSMPAKGLLSQTYTYTIEGKPLEKLSLSGKGTYSNAPPGPPKANVTQAFRTDPFPWLMANGTYSLDFQQAQVLGSQSPSHLHTASGALEVSPFSWVKLSAQPSFRADSLPGHGGRSLSRNFHQNYRLGLTPSFAGFNADYTLDEFTTWDGTTVGFPENFHQDTETLNVAGRKPLGQVNLEAAYKRSDQRQLNSAAVTAGESRTLTQNVTDSVSWSAGGFLTLAFSHAYNQLDRIVPGAGDIDNPLLPNGPDTFNTTFPLTGLNARTSAHTFTGRVTEQVTKELALYQEGGYTRTEDRLRGRGVDTYSPAAGFTWRAGSLLNWTAGYQYNASSGLVSTSIHKAQTTLTASFNPGSSLSLNWNLTRAENPFLQSQQGTASYTIKF